MQDDVLKSCNNRGLTKPREPVSPGPGNRYTEQGNVRVVLIHREYNRNLQYVDHAIEPYFQKEECLNTFCPELLLIL